MGNKNKMHMFLTIFQEKVNISIFQLLIDKNKILNALLDLPYLNELNPNMIKLFLKKKTEKSCPSLKPKKNNDKRI